MKYLNRSVLGISLLLAGMVQSARAAQPPGNACPPCEPGYQWIEETCYKEVEHCVCKVVPDVKKVKKIVYRPKEEPFCVRRACLTLGHKEQDCCCDAPKCTRCQGPYTHTILVKTEITCEEPTTKCVTEKVVELVPYVVRRKVPCCGEPKP